MLNFGKYEDEQDLFCHRRIETNSFNKQRNSTNYICIINSLLGIRVIILTEPFFHSCIYSFVHSVFVECLPCARLCLILKDSTVNRIDEVPTLVELTFHWKRTKNIHKYILCCVMIVVMKNKAG